MALLHLALDCFHSSFCYGVELAFCCLSDPKIAVQPSRGSPALQAAAQPVACPQHKTRPQQVSSQPIWVLPAPGMQLQGRGKSQVSL